MYGVLVLCFGKNQNHMSPGCNYGGVYCLMFGIFVLCMGYLCYVWDIYVMYGILVLCMGYLIVDLAFCTGYNLCASRRRTLRGLFFAKKSVLKMRNSVFPGF